MILNNLKLARMKAGLRQIDLAEKLGVSESLVTKWETGRSRPTRAILNKISIILGVGFNDLATDFNLREAQ